MATEIRSFDLINKTQIPSLGLGTWQSEPGLVGQAVTAAVKAGYRHIDCAQIYGNEKEIGLALKKLFEDGVVAREDLWITSKLWCNNHAPEDVPIALEKTLNDLQIEHLDLYLIHWPVRTKKGTAGFKPENLLKTDIPATWKAMEALFDIGKTRGLGVSNFSSKKLGDLLNVARIPPVVNQVECHPSWHQTKLREFCKSKGVHLSGYSPLGSPGTKWLKSNVLEHPILTSVADKLGKTPAQVAIRWGLQMGHSVLPKSTNKARIKENFAVFDWLIPDDLFTELSKIQQARLVRGDFLVNDVYGEYKTVEELWDVFHFLFHVVNEQLLMLEKSRFDDISKAEMLFTFVTIIAREKEKFTYTRCRRRSRRHRWRCRSDAGNEIDFQKKRNIPVGQNSKTSLSQRTCADVGVAKCNIVDVLGGREPRRNLGGEEKQTRMGAHTKGRKGDEVFVGLSLGQIR
ncbi:unnamed protein product [Lactuca saligna]|uniref:NADP-dependent oxidoreductase domain-containing protein n=1 Tax=Lactuca saligna TaxID=75948 RepID=A0AA35ZRI8_LACSI|nr:unnamed protein product [Lactuca saligna]